MCSKMPSALELLIPEDNPTTTEYIVGDASDKKALLRAMEGVEVAFYLIHSLGSISEFTTWDRELAAQFGQCASRSGIKRIIYLGGLGANFDEELSPHLKSRHEVGNVLRANADGVQVIEFRASIVLGAGSVSFEMIRSLVDRLPIMLIPKWVSTLAQPIGIDDLLQYLVRAIDFPLEHNPIFEIGGKDQVSYKGLMQEYARQKSLKRWMVPVPLLTPWLSSLWLALITPLYARVGRKLIESAICPTVVRDPLASYLFHISPIGFKEAMRCALESTPISRWNDSLSAAYIPEKWDKAHFGERFVNENSAVVNTTIEKAFAPIRCIGGKSGYYGCHWMWRLRGLLDLFMGGVGMRRGRRDREKLQKGDVVDFWRVEEYHLNSYLKLSAELKIPGRAWLEFQVEPCEEGCKIIQRASFDPAGAKGIIYWYLLYPFHQLVFACMLKGIIKRIGGK